MPDQPQHQIPEEFAGNEWLVDELFEQYQQDKNSVDKKWWPIFESMEEKEGGKTASTPTKSSAPAAASQSSAPQAAPAKKSAPEKKSAPADQPTQKAPAERKAPAKQETDAPQQSETKSASSSKLPIPAQLPEAGKNDVEAEEDKVETLRGPAKAVAANMDESLTVPTATTVRAVPAKVLIDNRTQINDYLKRTRGGKVSFTHIIGYAVVKALKAFPSQNVVYGENEKGRPAAIHPAHINFGLAIDMPKPDGSRNLVVPNIKKAETLNFAEFWAAYDDMVKRARDNKLTVEDFKGTTASLTNPGGIGTVHSVPRLSKGQACIIGVGALDYPAERRGTSPKTLAREGVSKILTLTSTYDHRVIQGAGSGEFLKLIDQYLLGEHGFYDEIFEVLRIPYEPVRWAVDNQVNPEEEINKVARIQQLIHSYRVRGHLIAEVNPLEYVMRKHPDLNIATYGLTLWDLDREWPTGGFGDAPKLTLRTILDLLREAYCRTLAVEYMHIESPSERQWFQQQLEHGYTKPGRDEQLRILGKLNAAEAFETFLQTKYIGQKRFSLEGGESLIPLLDSIISGAADQGLAGVGIGMAHRGRLNVLTNIAGKSYAQVFREFEGEQDPRLVGGSGDVKYHLGTEGVFTSDAGNETQVYLAANPSHLEAVNPVLEGIVRAKQDLLDEGGESDNAYGVLPILVHGDAAFAGQGIVAEIMQMSQLRGFKVGGTVHIVVNNQVGFTTTPGEGRSSTYATDIARMIQAPVFHVNADDPEAVVRVGQLAFEYRQRFKKDVVVDMVCYRRRGHNEADDPSMTQPLMYQLIEAKRSTRKLYTESLIGRGDISPEEADRALKDYQERLERVFTETHEAQTSSAPLVTGDAAAVSNIERPAAQQIEDSVYSPETTAVSQEVVARVGEVHNEMPEGFTIHKKLGQLVKKRHEMAQNGKIDWGFGELIAFGSLLMEGVQVRMSGQDVQRGTFVQRHSVLHDHETNAEWVPLRHLADDQAKFMIYNSLLSEYGVMGFEYGYSVERPDSLVIWEAQFGDFFNGAQMIIDEFISSAEQKWAQRSSLVLMLPHGYEGMGPDHSSARMERFLQLCAENNMTVAVPTTPANHFHLLRRHVYSRPHRPLVIMTPKQLLRLKAATSEVSDFTQGDFQAVIPDQGGLDDSSVKRVIMVSGRLYYDLAARREKKGLNNTAIIRVEQLYPLPLDEIKEQLARYPEADVVWAQDEPANQGQWPYLSVSMLPLLDREVRLVSRPASASPATGTGKRHQAELEHLVQQSFD
ncbi:multifunctional oxoglutarate decarboxylase/oxoglutarate dehydrogenase thiamine pyrophosphate-binding subunit/dihydrolipoyllysine-residue succinyltransferase subunit [Kocuria massiliensis]|uniref:multifunctional oxoglutarate decarboxylase/oxoglutarate dehydrogenase thiamine pyrophosphate-binding subunit/dihydrolipoyllysine-residue succinyltransferase subunit n=1 Tax=Kocuria massiliensis TaxID=1926282 RepID=UPI000660745C|nr:multifunctional oxoglutarate decarboxylase/oxoglutarate dehydrogenase thiamine pyrophosphate-binding subunit/dihydrolipoyllysine-residue succinyltransferase subunit [Kocuria massiliensis]MCT1367565.1 multifunctional oxoglutarate decarboxylase/oxoglutarate dehydrogenase thiamine pyrophosphate-binding subunit/dihydrolipoyllysine-residue succinyltransferase subunit [Rothia sp. p3-SID1597]